MKDILDWADAHHQRIGAWPADSSGAIPESPGETWWSVDFALKRGTRSLPGNSSLPQLLLAHRGARTNRTAPQLSVEQILDWAKAHHRRTGNWPTSHSGPIRGSSGENWGVIDGALRGGHRGLRGGSSVAKLLAEQGWKINQGNQRELTCAMILRWADIHKEETENWPNACSGKVHHVRGETWRRVDSALRDGLRGLPGGSSLAQLLADRRGVRNCAAVPALTAEQILEWADAHHSRTGEWPRIHSGPIPEAPGETWTKMQTALREGGRGLPGGSTLARLLAERRGAANDMIRPAITTEQILAWAEAHRGRAGSWPTRRPGPIPEAPGENWCKVDTALQKGYRGLPGGLSLFCLLRAHYGV